MGRRIKKLLFALVTIFVSSISFAEDFKPIAVIDFSQAGKSNLEVNTSEYPYINEKGEPRKSETIFVENLDLPESQNIVFKIEIASRRPIIKRDNKYFFYREFTDMFVPVQIWIIDLNYNNATYLLNTKGSISVSNSGRFLCHYEDYALANGKFYVLDLQENKYVWHYDISEDLANMYPNFNPSYERMRVDLRYDSERALFYADTRVSTSQELGEYKRVYFPKVFE